VDQQIIDLLFKVDGLSIIEHCPHCESYVSPILIDSNNFYDESMNLTMETYILKCSRFNCGRYYMVDAWLDNQFGTNKYYVIDAIKYPNNISNYSDKEIENISSDFIEIYNESISAENAKLLKICGCGYRKAIEFLIKDYIIYSNRNDGSFDVEKIKSSVKIMNLIKEYFNDNPIKSVAEKIFWLGNDETHYQRKWKNKDISDMKKLIEILLYKIKMEISYEKYELEMDTQKKDV